MAFERYHGTFGLFALLSIVGCPPPAVTPDASVEPATPTLSISANPASGPLPLTVQFTADSTLAVGATVAQLRWLFGDGSSGSDAEPSHVYFAVGDYDVVCVVTDSNGKSATAHATVSVSEHVIQADYVGSTACRGCHSATHAAWLQSGHASAIKQVSAGAAPSFPFSAVTAAPASMTWSQVSYLLGGYKWKALFLDASGQLVVGSDVQYNLAASTFVGYGASARGAIDQSCGQCHATGWQALADNGGQHQDGLSGMLGTWQEPGVGCEACHGPGSEHVAAPASYNILVDRTAAACGVCHSRDPQHRVLVDNGLVPDQAQYDQWLNARHGIDGAHCAKCHDPHASVVYDAQATGTGLIRTCVDCHGDAPAVSGAMASLDCIECHMPYAVVVASVSGTGVHQRGDQRLHSWDIDATGVDLASFVETDGSATWVHLDATQRARVNLAWACMQCHDGSSAFAITSYTEAATRAQGMHGN